MSIFQPTCATDQNEVHKASWNEGIDSRQQAKSAALQARNGFRMSEIGCGMTCQSFRWKLEDEYCFSGYPPAISSPWWAKKMLRMELLTKNVINMFSIATNVEIDVATIQWNQFQDLGFVDTLEA
ncbi:hypothetical protein Tco_0551223 [Tanacetum coccineum]